VAITWENSFDGPNNTSITVANSAGFGDPVSFVDGAPAYDTSWAAHGTASARLGTPTGSGGGTIAATLAGDAWSMRAYALIPAGGWMTSRGPDDFLWNLDDDQGIWEILGQDVTAHAGSLAGQPIRIEVSRIGATATARVWWTDPDSAGAHDLQVQASASGWPPLAEGEWDGGGFGTPPPRLDEVAVAQGEWIGPVSTPIDETGAAEGFLELYGEADGYPSWVGAAEGTLVLYGQADGRAQGLTPAEGWLELYGEASGWAGHVGAADGTLVLYGEASGAASTGSAAEGFLELYGEADGLAGASVATGRPVRDMWLGPLGLLHRMRRRGEWVRTPALGAEAHVSLHGLVTASRARSAPRTTSLSWERLDRVDADALEELALVPARADATVAVVDPDAAAGNLFTPEQSRGRPGPGSAPVAVEHLYQATGPGEVTVGLVGGVRHAVIDGAESGTDIRWLHPYYGVRGWPVMPGWPVYMAAATGGGALSGAGRLWLTFYDHSGAVISSAAGLQGDGQCQADAPAGAATVSPHLIISEAAPGLRLLGEARLAYAPQPADARPLGNGCPIYSVVSYSDAPYLPWRSTTLELQEVRTLAYR
jgi:hypothetical protein